MDTQYDDIVLKRLTKEEGQKIIESVNYHAKLIADVNFNDTHWKKQLSPETTNYEYEDTFLRPTLIKDNLFLINGPRVPTAPQANSIYVRDTPSDKSWPDHFLKCRTQGQPSSLEKYVELQKKVLGIQKKEILDLITIFYQSVVSNSSDPIKKAKSDSAIQLANNHLNEYIKTKHNINLNYPNPLSLLINIKDGSIETLKYENYIDVVSKKKT